jgi:hypothetical protein
VYSVHTRDLATRLDGGSKPPTSTHYNVNYSRRKLPLWINSSPTKKITWGYIGFDNGTGGLENESSPDNCKSRLFSSLI